MEHHAEHHADQSAGSRAGFSYETSDLPRIDGAPAVKISPASFVRRSGRTAAKCWSSPVLPAWERRKNQKGAGGGGAAN